MSTAGSGPNVVAFVRKFAGAIGFAVVVAVVSIVIALSNNRDEESYQAGKDAGAIFARQYSQLTSDGRSDNQVRAACRGLVPDSSTFDHFDRDDFVDGCFETVRSALQGG